MNKRAATQKTSARYRQETRHLLAEVQAALGECFERLEKAADEPASRSVLRCIEQLRQVQHGVLEQDYGSPGAVRAFDALAAAAGLLRDSMLSERPQLLELAWLFVGAAAGRLEAAAARRQVAQRAGSSVSTKRLNTRAAKLRARIQQTPSATIAELASEFETDESWIRKVKRQALAGMRSPD
jgi:hypothetical protein